MTEPGTESRLDRLAVLEEMFNSISHGFGLALSLAGFAVLVALAVLHGDAWRVVGCSVFGISLVLLYTASTLYHSARRTEFRRVFRVLDHSAIYILIAGTYTPFTLISLRGDVGWTLLVAIWALAVCGVIFKVFHAGKFGFASTALYIVMGWAGLVAIKPILNLVPGWGVVWLFAGGCCYTVGVVFYAWRRLPFNHAVWHVFVLAGSICHYLAVLGYVLPQQS